MPQVSEISWLFSSLLFLGYILISMMLISFSYFLVGKVFSYFLFKNYKGIILV